MWHPPHGKDLRAGWAGETGICLYQVRLKSGSARISPIAAGLIHCLSDCDKEVAMSIENARQFIDLVQNCASLQHRLQGVSADDRTTALTRIVNIARESGLPFTPFHYEEAARQKNEQIVRVKKIAGVGTQQQAGESGTGCQISVAGLVAAYMQQ